MNTGTIWDAIIEYGIATEKELELITAINGYNDGTLNDVIFVRTGCRSIEQLLEEEQEVQEMKGRTYTILYNTISDYKNKYYNDPCNGERVAIYETQVIRWIKNAKIIGSITPDEARALYDYAFGK